MDFRKQAFVFLFFSLICLNRFVTWIRRTKWLQLRMYRIKTDYDHSSVVSLHYCNHLPKWDVFLSGIIGDEPTADNDIVLSSYFICSIQRKFTQFSIVYVFFENCCRRLYSKHQSHILLLITKLFIEDHDHRLVSLLRFVCFNLSIYILHLFNIFFLYMNMLVT